MNSQNFILWLLLVVAWSSLLSCGTADAFEDKEVLAAEAELRALSAKVSAFQVIDLPTAPGEVVLRPEHSLTVEHLRGVVLDEDAPKLEQPNAPYEPRMIDTYPQGQAPYVASGIQPFRFRYFQCEFNYGGLHNRVMSDYASTRGFNIIYAYDRDVDQGGHLPPGTKWLAWGCHIDWTKWFAEHNLPDGRYDLLVDYDLVKLHLIEGKLHRPKIPTRLSDRGDYLMIDMEHPVLPPEQLKQQPWYVGDEASELQRESFEKRYYDGYSQTYTSAVQAARQEGWRNVSLYGWAPYGRTWGGFEQPEVDSGSEHAWNTFGKQIYEAVDIVNNSVYCFYWSPQNTAYTLANIDANMERVKAMPVQKPVRPYYWTLLHGGGGDWRWWRDQPLANEEQRAMIALAFFTGIDGFDLWNWSGMGNHHVPPLLQDALENQDDYTSGPDLMIKDAFDLLPENAVADAKPERFRQYDVVHLLSVDEAQGSARFQKIRPHTENEGVSADQPVYALPIEQLRRHLRVKSEPVAAVIEGMALIYPFEFMVRHGRVKIDVPARLQFSETLPIVRRIQCGPYHLLITYDPAVVYGGESREITLPDFDGHPGLTLRLHADAQTRVYVLATKTD